MKKRKIMLLLPCAALLLGGCSFQDVKNWVGNNIYFPVRNWVEDIFNPDGKKEEQEAKLQSIALSGEFDTTYKVGDQFDPSGLVVTASYSDGSTKDVTSEATLSGFDSSEAGTCTVTVSFGGQTAEFTCKINRAEWSAEEKALFDQVLYGVELPFFDVEGATVSLNSSSGKLNIFDEEGQFLAVSGTDISDYAAKFAASDGWEDVSYQYSVYSTAPAGSFFVFERSVETQQGFRRISVQFFGNDGTSYNTTGDFYFFANDPFSYEFPSAELAAEFEKCGLTAFTLPEPQKEGLVYYEYAANSNNVTYAGYYSAGYFSYDEIHSYIYSIFYIYGFSGSDFSDYITLLSNNDWTMTPGQGGNDYDYYGAKQIGELGIAHIQIADATDYVILNIELLLEDLPKAEWPSEDITTYFTEYGATEYAFPSFEGESVSYKCTEYLYYGLYPYGVQINVVGATEQEVSTFLNTTLPGQDWTVTEDTENEMFNATKCFESLGGNQANVSMYTDETSGDFVIIMLYDPTVVIWPAEGVNKIVQVLAPGSETVVPSLPGDSYSFYGSQELDVYGESSLLETYIGILTSEENKWTADPSAENTFISPNQDLAISLNYSAQYGCLEITFNSYIAPSAEWPTDQVAALFPAGLEDSLPAFEGDAESFQVYTDYGTGVLVNVGEGNEEQAITDYCATLVDAKFVAIPNDSDRNFYRSEHDEFTIEVYKGTDGCIGIEISAIKGFLNRGINAYFAAQGYSFTSPDFSAYESICIYAGEPDWYFQAQFTGDVASQLTAILANNGFDVPDTPSENYGYECYLEADNDVEIDVKYNSSTGITNMTVYYWGY